MTPVDAVPRLGAGYTWRLPVDLYAVGMEERLRTIPGLHFDFEAGCVHGSADAVAAACLRLGIRRIPSRHRPTPDTVSRIPTAASLRKYQAEGVATSAAICGVYGGVLIADDVGLGKTREGIALAEHLGGRVMVGTTGATRETWREELTKLGYKPEDIAVLRHAATKADQAEWDRAPGARWVISSYDHRMLDRAYQTAFAGQGQSPNVLLLDEVHRLRGRKALRGRVMEDIAMCTPYRIGMSGTPMWDRPRDLFEVLRLLFGGLWQNQYAFDLAYAAGFHNDHGGWENKGASNVKELKLRLSYYMIRRLKSEVMSELPPLTRQITWLDPIPSATVAMKKALMHPDAGMTQAALEACLEAKLETAVDLAEEAGRFLLFTWMRKDAQTLGQMLGKRGVRCTVITGDQTDKVRAALAADAIRRGIGIVATYDSMGEGVNIQGVASTGILHAFPWEPLKIAQIEGRLHRQGQTGNVHWKYVALRESMDALVINKVVLKLEAQRDLMDGHGGSAAKIRNTLNDNMDDVASQKAALRAIYEAL